MIANGNHGWQSRAIMNSSPRSPESISRRSFFGISAALTSAVAAPVSFTASAAGPSASAHARKHRIGLELYSVRGELTRDLPNTLNTVAGFGYEVVEFYSPYFKWTPAYAKDVRAQMDDLGLRCYSTHNGFESITPGENLAHAIELNQILGARYLILAGAPGGTSGMDGWKRVCEKFTGAAEQLEPHGLAAGFHNHGSEWRKLENGRRIMELIAANTPKQFVLQLDVGTCEEAGADPVAWVNANPGRIKIMHLKDWAPGGSAEDKGYRVLFGEGVTPWKELMAAAETTGGLEFFLIEQEGSRFSEFETAKRCLENWKKMFGTA
jgi:sugar phosphate isomerase/epimerase